MTFRQATEYFYEGRYILIRENWLSVNSSSTMNLKLISNLLREITEKISEFNSSSQNLSLKKVYFDALILQEQIKSEMRGHLESKDIFENIAEDISKLFSPHDTTTLKAKALVAFYYKQAGEWDKATMHYKELVDSYNAIDSNSYEALSASLDLASTLSTCYSRTELDEAETIADSVLKNLYERWNFEHPLYFRSALILCDILLRKSEILSLPEDEIYYLASRAESIITPPIFTNLNNKQKENDLLFLTHINYARILTLQGYKQEALDILESIHSGINFIDSSYHPILFTHFARLLWLFPDKKSKAREIAEKALAAAGNSYKLEDKLYAEFLLKDILGTDSD